MRFSQHIQRELQKESPYGRILPCFDTTFNPRSGKEALVFTSFSVTVNTVTVKTTDFSTDEAYLISFSCATKTYPRGKLRLNSTPFLGLPRGRLLLFILINLLAGDINLNPGPVINDTSSNSATVTDSRTTTRNRPVNLNPGEKRSRGRKPKYPCGLCGRYAVKNDCIQCSSCDAWFHENCSGISDDTMNCMLITQASFGYAQYVMI